LLPLKSRSLITALEGNGQFQIAGLAACGKDLDILPGYAGNRIATSCYSMG
jgi:hypothetical protein